MLSEPHMVLGRRSGQARGHEEQAGLRLLGPIRKELKERTILHASLQKKLLGF